MPLLLLLLCKSQKAKSTDKRYRKFCFCSIYLCQKLAYAFSTYRQCIKCLWYSLYQVLTRKKQQFGTTYPSPSSVMAVSASTLSTNPTVVLSLQSIPKRHDSSPRRPILDTTTKYLVRWGWTLSSFTACNKTRSLRQYSKSVLIAKFPTYYS